MKLHTNGTLSKVRLGQRPLRVVSLFSFAELVALSALVDEAGPKVNKTHLYEEMLEHATPSEAAVCLYLSALLSLA